MKRAKVDKKTKNRYFSRYLHALRLAFRLFPEELSVSLLFSLASRITGFFSTSYMLRYLLNGLQNGKAFSSLVLYLVLVLSAGMIFSLGSELYQLFLYPKFHRIGIYRLNRMIYEKSLSLDLSDYESPEMYALYNDVMKIGVEAIEQIPYSLQMLLGQILSISFSVYLALAIQPILLLFVLIPFAFNLMNFQINKKCYEFDKKDNCISREIDYAERTFYFKEYAKEMRMTSIYRVMFRRFEDAISQFKTLVRTRGLRIAISVLIMNLGIEVITYLVAESYCIYQTLVLHTMYAGDCLVMFTLFGNVFNNITALQNTVIYAGNISLRVSDFIDYMKREPKICENSDGAIATKGTIEFRNVSFRYRDDTEYAVRNLNLIIREGEKIMLAGQNGAGKSTLVKLMMRLYVPTEGEILLNGKNISDYSLKSYRDLFGVVFQDHRIFALTIAENVLGRPYIEADKATVVNALKRVGLWEKVCTLPLGIHTPMTREFEKDGVVMSGGEMQRLAIASVYSKKAGVAILDEPSSALDPIAEATLYKELYEMGRDKTVLYISHRLSAALNVDKILYLQEGEVVEQGTHSELIALGGYYAEVFGTQAKNYCPKIQLEKRR